MKEAAPEGDWETKARVAINRADQFIVMLGSRTRFASGVKREVGMAKSLGKTRFRFIGYRDGSRDWAVPDAGVIHNWNWDNLKKLLA